MRRFVKRLCALEVRKRTLEAQREIVEVPEEIDRDAEIARQLRTSPDYGIAFIWEYLERISAAGEPAYLKPETWAKVAGKRTQR